MLETHNFDAIDDIAKCLEMNPNEISDIKLAINNLIWMYAPGSTTLKEAESIAIQILEMINTGKPKV